MEITIKIDAPGLETALQDLAQALREGGIAQPTQVTLDPEKVAQATEKDATPEPAKEEPTKTAEKPTEEPKKETAPTGLTFEQVRVKLAEVSQAGKQKELKELITSFGAGKLSDIPEEKFAELLEKAAEL